MPRKEKIVRINDKDITVKELRTDDVCALFASNEMLQAMVGASSGLPGDIKKLLKYSLDSITDEDLEVLTENYSSYLELEAAFREVNKPFFDSLPAKIEGLVGLGVIAAKKMGVSLKSLAPSSK